MQKSYKRNFHYIYKITRNNSDRYYIGMHSTDNLNDGYFGSGARLWKSINKYGKENHTMEILEFCESREHLRIREKELIGDLWKLDENCMNILPGGDQGIAGYKFTESQRQKISEDLKKRWSDPEYKEKMRQKAKDSWTEERKNKQSEMLLGKKRPEHSKKMKGRPLNRNHPWCHGVKTKEHAQNISHSLTGRALSEEHKQNLSVPKIRCCRLHDKKEMSVNAYTRWLNSFL